MSGWSRARKSTEMSRDESEQNSRKQNGQVVGAAGGEEGEGWSVET